MNPNGRDETTNISGANSYLDVAKLGGARN